MLKSFWTCQSFGLILRILSVRTIKYAAEIFFFVSPNEILPVKSFGLTFFDITGTYNLKVFVYDVQHNNTYTSFTLPCGDRPEIVGELVSITIVTSD